MIMKIIQIKTCELQLKALFREIFINNSFVGGKGRSKIIYLGIRKFKKEQQMKPKESKRRK